MTKQNKILALLVIAYLAITTFQLKYDYEKFSLVGNLWFFVGGFIVTLIYILFKKGETE